MVADLIFDTSAADTTSARLECEGEGQSEFGRAVVARRNPFRTQARYGLRAEAAPAPHGSFDFGQTGKRTLPAFGAPGMLGDGEKRIGKPSFRRRKPSGCVAAACFSTQAVQPRVEVVDASQRPGVFIRRLEPAQGNGQVRLPIALDVTISLECPDPSCDPQTLDGSGDVEGLPRGFRADLGAALGKQPAQLRMGQRM